MKDSLPTLSNRTVGGKRPTLKVLEQPKRMKPSLAMKNMLLELRSQKKVHEHEIRMDLDAMIQILSHHHEALGVDHLVYPALKRLKALRNRVHLQMLESDTDHDYNAFDYSIKEEMGSILFTILTSSMVTELPQVFEFLKVNVHDEGTAV